MILQSYKRHYDIQNAWKVKKIKEGTSAKSQTFEEELDSRGCFFQCQVALGNFQVYKFLQECKIKNKHKTHERRTQAVFQG